MTNEGVIKVKISSSGMLNKLQIFRYCVDPHQEIEIGIAISRYDFALRALYNQAKMGRLSSMRRVKKLKVQVRGELTRDPFVRRDI